ncbi:uncharacterized protein LOC123888497 [Trifolium pratense]|uniref:Uncharacterized protein n=1 Tax=Trifolium pratense TaxID=57577 RepID=A0ACB0K2N9_TRIPR|nr:uncharacterized protein LOC123888497 [Trifolium pratense]CAJ2651431.1 unnamed protein product [Trifolium pratense]
MAASMSSFLPMKPRGAYLKRFNTRQRMQVIKVQNYQDEGRFTNMVDANLNVLKERIEMVKVKERFERCCKCQQGWNYVPLSINNDYQKNKRNRELKSFIELIGLVCGTIGATSFAGTLFICLVSLLVHWQV